MQKLLWVVILLLLLGGGYYIFTSQSATEDAVQNSEEASVPENSPMESGEGMMEDGSMMESGGGPAFQVVSFTEAGYEPKSITVRKGETVRFINNATSQETWPASAVHPTHSVYPEKTSADCLGSAFDACRGLKPGEFWDFTFNQTGEWRFHDHIHASKTGVVIVE